MQEKLKNVPGQTGKTVCDRTNEQEDLLSKVNNSSVPNGNHEQGGDDKWELFKSCFPAFLGAWRIGIHSPGQSGWTAEEKPNIFVVTEQSDSFRGILHPTVTRIS